jgi:hypothetical protein
MRDAHRWLPCTRALPAALVLASAVGVRPAGAQAIRTTLLGAGSREPVAGAFVVVTDTAGHEITRTLTDETGRVRFELVPGTYRLLVLRIGLARWRTAAFSLAAGDTVTTPIEAPETAVLLSEIAVHAERRCRLQPEEGTGAATLWEEARKALEATEWTIAHPVYRFRASRYVRIFGPVPDRPTTEERRQSAGYSTWPFVSLPAESLAAGGFAQPDSLGVVTYYGPDLPVLLSESFLGLHCFRVRRAEGARQDSLIGLGFEPVSGGRGRVDIAGVLWLDQRSAELRELEFRYTNLGRWSGRGATGLVVFERLPNRAWVIRRWSIRMPIPQVGPKPLVAGGMIPTAPVDTIGIAGYREEGGWVTVVLSARGRPVAVYPDEP